MEFTKINLSEIQSEARKAAFSTDDHSIDENPAILQGYKQDFNKIRLKYSLQLQEKIKRIEKVIRKWDSISDPTSSKKFIESRLSKFLSFNSESHRSSLRTPYENFKQRDHNYKQFQRQHNRTLEPIRSDNKTIGWVIVIGLFLAEVIANYQLFQGVTGSNTEAGRQTALVLSASQSFFNVVTGYMVGSLLWGKVLFGDKPTKKILATILSVIHIALAVWVNMAIGLWRAILATNAQGGVQIPSWRALDPFSNFLYFNGQMEAILVAMVGMVFALVAYFDGWFSDDPYPQYGARLREVKKASKILNDSKESLYKKWREATDLYSKVSAEVVQEAYKSLDGWNESVNELQQIFTDWKADILEAEKSYAIARDTYEVAFNKAISDKSKKVTLPKEGLWENTQSDPNLVFDDGAHHHLDDGRRNTEFKKRKADYNSMFNKLSEEWDKFKMVTTEDLNKLVKEYDD